MLMLEVHAGPQFDILYALRRDRLNEAASRLGINTAAFPNKTGLVNALLEKMDARVVLVPKGSTP